MTGIARAAFVLAVSSAAPLAGQEADSALADRVRRLEALVDLLRQQMGAQAEAPVTTRDGNQIELAGRILINGFFNNAKVNNSDVPQFVLPPDPPTGLPASAGGATARQSRLTATVFAPEVLGASFVGEVDVDFFGGQLPSSGGRFFPVIRLRRVRADLAWRHATVMIGQEAPLIAELNPSSIGAIGVPGFTASGNLWLWIPQIRLGLRTGSAFRVGIEGAALAPTLGTPQGSFATQPDRAELSRRPFVQGRLRGSWGDPDDRSEISVGGHYGWIAAPGDSLLSSRAAAAAVRFRITRYAEIRGELFSGEGLGTLGGGAIGQTLGTADAPVGTAGGWVQLNLFPSAEWEVGGGIGVDDPDDADLPPVGSRFENRSYEGHLHWRPRPLVFGVEFRRIETTYGAAVGIAAVNHVNVAAGFVF